MERPDHEDLRTLIDIIAQGKDAEADAQGKDFDLGEYCAPYIDTKSLSYMALQRAMLISGLKSPTDVMTHLDTVMRMASLYMEGVVAGIQFERRRAS